MTSCARFFVAALVATLAAGCSTTHSASPSGPATVQLAPSSPPESPSASLSAADLQSAPVPSACGHPAGDLVYGKLPLIPDNEGFVSLAQEPDQLGEPFHVEASLRGEGSQILAVLDCSVGGVGWPQILVLYGPGPTILGSLDLSTVEFVDGGEPVNNSHVVVAVMEPVEGGVQLEVETYDGAYNEVRRWSAVARLLDVGLVVEDLSLMSGPDHPYPTLG